MKAFPRRQKVLGSALLLVGAAWSVDYLIGGARPAQVRAAGGAAAEVASSPAEATTEGPDIEELLRVVEASYGSRDALEPGRLRRDLFVPVGPLKAVARRSSPSSPLELEGAEEPRAPEPPFEQRHRLQGILTGRVPLAVIDGELFRVGARIDGYTLLRIERDRVICRRGQRRVVLQLEQPSR